MFFTIKNRKYLTTDQLRIDTLMNAYFVIKNFPLKASDIVLDNFLQNQYKSDIKNLCIKLLLNLTFYSTDSGDLVLLFKNPKDDKLAQLITYGNGALVGSTILQSAFKT